MSLKGKIALVTGGASGFGRALVIRLVYCGAKVMIVDLDPRASTVANQINNAVGRQVSHAFVGNVLDPGFRDKTITAAQELFGRPAQIVIPAAGISGDGALVSIKDGKVCQLPENLIRQIFELNLAAPILWVQKCWAEYLAWKLETAPLPSLDSWFRAILTGSVIGQTGNFGQVPYGGTKGALNSFVPSLLPEMMKYGGPNCRCGVVHPGFMNTPMVQKLGEKVIVKHILPKVRIKRLLDPAEVARKVCEEQILPDEPMIRLDVTGGYDPSNSPDCEGIIYDPLPSDSDGLAIIMSTGQGPTAAEIINAAKGEAAVSVG
jgi:NAD(P)-dependent dehydrogenase (short-subunit alcohol dehydrogenase family)